MPMVVDQHACSPSSRELGAWLVAKVGEHAVLLVQQWLHVVDLAHNFGEFYVPLPLVVDNPLGHHVAMRRVAEQVLKKVEVVGQLSMAVLACMVRWLHIDVTQTPFPIDGVSLR